MNKKKINIDFDKIIIIILICICAYFVLSELKNREETKYYIEKKAYKICGKEIYITDFTYGQTLDTRALFNEIESICKE